MIACTLADAERYAGLHPLFPRALTLAADGDLRARAPGSYDLGQGLHVNLDAGQTQPASERRFESHRDHIDIQVVLAGPERMQWARTADLTVDQPFTAEADIAFYATPERIAGEAVLHPDELAIFFPEDAHRPCCDPGADSVAFRKLVFKVPVASG